MNPATFCDFIPSLVSLWKDAAIQDVFSRRGQFQLGESIRYYMNEINRVQEINYLPNTVSNADKYINDVLADVALKWVLEMSLLLKNILLEKFGNRDPEIYWIFGSQNCNIFSENHLRLLSYEGFKF